jgi:hypothetical protein
MQTTPKNLALSNRRPDVEFCLQIPIVLLLMLIAHGQAGPWAMMSRQVLLTVLVLYGLALCLGHGGSWREHVPHRMVGLLSLSAFYGIAVCSDRPLLLGVSVLFYLVARFAFLGAPDAEYRTFLRGTLLFVVAANLFYLLGENLLGSLWLGLNRASVELCARVNPRLRFASSASMMKITIYGLLLATSLFLTCRPRRVFGYLAFCGLAVLLNAVYLSCMHWVPPKSWGVGLGQSEYEFGKFPVYRSFWEFPSMFDLALPYGLLLAALCGFLLFRFRRPVPAGPSGQVSWKALLLFDVEIACLAGFCALQAGYVTFRDWKSPKVGWYCEWNESYPAYSEYQSYGLITLGMYGTFLDDLRRHEVQVVPLCPPDRKQPGPALPAEPNADASAQPGPVGPERQTPAPPIASLSEASLKNLDLLIVMVRTAPFSAAELDALRNYLQEGGRILLIGDHTNLEQCQIPFNQLAEPYHIRLEFDSAFSFISWWFFNIRQSMALPFVAHNPGAYGIATGGSLTVRSPARPVLAGTYAFGDIGNIFKSSKKEAFLGDYTYQHGEYLGDVVLAATARVGRGRLVAFGDSSSFQNIAYAESADFVRHLLGWMLGCCRRPYLPGAGPVFLATALLLLLVWLFRGHRRGHGAITGLYIAGVVLSLAFRAGGESLANPHGKQCLLLRTPLSQINRDKFKKGSYLGLPVNLNRAGYSVRWIDELDASALRGSDLLVLPAPSRPLTYRQKRLT